MSSASKSPCVPGELRVKSLFLGVAIFLAIDLGLYSAVRRAFTRQPSVNAEIDQRLQKASDRLDEAEQRAEAVASDIKAVQATVDQISRELDDLKKTTASSSDIQRLATAVRQIQSKLTPGAVKK
jgi:peptidoglycan hydrolase CwlO-like protein